MIFVGSYTWSKPNPGDIDVMAVCSGRSIPKLLGKSLSLLGFKDEIQARNSYCNYSQSLKGTFNNYTVYIWAYNFTQFENLASMECEAINYVRTTPSKPHCLIYNLRGEILDYPISVSPFKESLVLVRELNFVRVKEMTYLGVRPNALLKRPLIIKDYKSSASSVIDSLWDSVHSICVKEVGNKFLDGENCL